MKDNSIKEISMEKVNLHGTIVRFMKVNGYEILELAMLHSNGTMDQNTLVKSLKIKCMARENTFMSVETDILDSSYSINST
jgi:hypothetical protein